MDLEVSITSAAGATVVAVSGVVDMSTVPDLHDLLRRVTSDHPGAVVAVDLDGVEVLDDAGLGVLLGAAARAREAGGDLVVVSSRLGDRFRASGFDRAVRVHAGLGELRT
jgi:anti-sigma B factor antagonist